MIKGMIKAAVFDLDNTIYDYDKCDRYAVKKLRNHCGKVYGLSAENFDQLYEKAKIITKKRLGAVAASHNRMLYAQNLMELLRKRPVSYALELYDIYWNAMLEHMEPYGYVLPLFERLERIGIRIAVLTDLTVHIQHRKIRKLGIADYISVLVTSEEAGKEKPDKAAFELVLEKLNLLPHQVIMVGDSYEKDIAGARNAGMHGILFSRESADRIWTECIEQMVYDDSI